MILLVFIVVPVATFFYVDAQHGLTLASVKAQQATMIAYREAQPLQALLLYGLIYIVVTALSLPGATVLTLIGGAVFGLVWGTVIVSFASTIGATLAFLAARFLFRDYLQAKFSQRLQTINQGIMRDGAVYLFTLRLVPLFPFFLINVLMGLTPLTTATFYGVSQVGMLAGTLVYVNAGTQLAQLETLSGILSPLMVASLVLLGVFPLIAKKIVAYFFHD